MELSVYLKSIIDQDICPIVICNLEHEIIYMNPEAVERYAKRGGIELIGKSLLNCHNEDSNSKIKKVVENEFLYNDLANKMKDVMGTKVNIATKGNGKGKIEIEYYSDDELERMFDMIMSLGRRE